MSAVIIGLLAGAGIGAWVYSQGMRRTGGNTKSALIVAGVVALIVFVFVWSVALMIDSALGKN